VNYSVNYNEINKSIGKSKLAKIFGWIFLVSGVLGFIISLATYLDWKSKEDNYNKQYVYSSNGDLYYEMNNDKIYIDKIYNTNDEIIELEVPEQKTVIMYCSNKNINECIYFDMNNSFDTGMLNPFLSFLATLFLIALGIFFVNKTRTKRDSQNNEKTSLSSIYMLYVFLLVLGTSLLIWQIYNAVNYFNLKNDNNITTATIYSEIYNIGGSKNSYKPVSYYYVDNQKYVYVNDSYIEGKLEDNLGKTFELYYNKNNPGEVSEKENPVNFLLVIIGIGFIAFSLPFVFIKGKMEKRIDKVVEEQNKQEWKI